MLFIGGLGIVADCVCGSGIGADGSAGIAIILRSRLYGLVSRVFWQGCYKGIGSINGRVWVAFRGPTFCVRVMHARVRVWLDLRFTATGMVSLAFASPPSGIAAATWQWDRGVKVRSKQGRALALAVYGKAKTWLNSGSRFLRVWNLH